MTTKIYDIRACECNIAGISLKDQIVSYASSVEGPAFEDESGADGGVVRYATNERRMTFTVTFKGSSTHNEELSALLITDESATNGAGVVPFFFKDGNGSSIVSSSAAWIRQLPDKEHGQAPGDVAWEIRVVRDNPTQVVIGGN